MNDPLALSITEEQLQNATIQTAHSLGWIVAHFRPALTQRGWRTPVQADGKGFPDLVLVRDRVIFVELKRESGKPTRDQRVWMEKLEAAGAEVYLWKPSHLRSGEIEETLRRNGRAE